MAVSLLDRLLDHYVEVEGTQKYYYNGLAITVPT